MDKVNEDNCRQAILERRPLLQNVTDEDWQKYRNIARPFRIFIKIDDPYTAVVDALEKNRPKILAVICSTYGGVAWLKEQINIGCQKMDIAKSSFTRD